ncbi:MAG: hypothetical protein J6Y03_05090 [Alphaproteobacteria bacterium]|nr:hypothetical protein [Alphaproteobacteria bacterium]
MKECYFEVAYKPAENEDGFIIDTEGNNKDVTSFAMVVDEVGDRKKSIFPNEETTENSWTGLLKEEISRLAMDAEKTLPEIVLGVTKEANNKISHIAADTFENQSPATSVLVTRINNGVFEAFSNGGCAMIVRYQDDTLETFSANDTDFNEKPVAARVSKISHNKNRSFSTYTNGAMWGLSARVETIQSVALFPSGIESKQVEARKMLECLSALGSLLNTNQHTVAEQSANNEEVQKIASADRTALLFNLVDEFTNKKV